MNTNPDAIRILCYGDSLTFGHDADNDRRFNINERWTGIMQDILGSQYEVIEEGLGGRTTDIEDDKRPGRNGLYFFRGAVMSHVPLDFIFILLGSNDLKSRFNRTPVQIANAFKNYKSAIQEACDKWEVEFPRVFLVSPPIINESLTPKEWGMEGAEEKSRLLASEYCRVATELNFDFVDIAPVVELSKNDGTHIIKSSNHSIAQLLSSKILDSGYSASS